MNLTAEQQFLLRLVGCRLPDAGAADLERQAATIDWRRVLAGATELFYPYVDHCVRHRLRGDPLPEDVREQLARVARANTVLHMLQAREFRRIVTALSDLAIPVVALKGMPLAYQVYPEPATRAMVDIDLLVREEDWERARRAVLDLGLRVPARWAVRAATGPYAASDMDRPFERPGTPVLVELHDDLESARPPFAFTMEAAWARSRPASVAGVPTRVLHPEDFLIHLCLHASSIDRFRHGLRPLVDILLFVERHADGWDWPALAAACRAQGNAGWMYLTLKLVRDLLGAPVPDGFFAALPVPAHLAEAERLALEQIWEMHTSLIPRSLAEGLAIEDRWGRVGWFLRRLNPWEQEDVGPTPTAATVARGVLAGARRGVVYMWALQRRLRAAWRQGGLSPASLERTMRLQRGRERLRRLMTGGER